MTDGERDPERDADWLACAVWCGVALLVLVLLAVGAWFVRLLES